MARLYADENFPRPVVDHLRALGHDVLTAQEAGKAGQSITDDQVLLFATKQARSVLTINRRHFIKLHVEVPSHAGIIVCTYDPDFSGQAGRIDVEIQNASKLSGVLLRVNRPS